MKLDPIAYQFDFKHRRAFVTGAGKGIGREIAGMLTRFNARVIALSRTEKDLQSLKEETGCQTIIADLADPVSAKQAAESNRGKQSQSIDPSRPTRAAVALLPMSA